MKIERIVIDEEKKIIRITTTDERWYAKTNQSGEVVYIPSVTWICEYYPKGIGFYKWLANKGWDEAVALKEAAGDKGSKVHKAISLLLQGETIKYNSMILNPTSQKEEEITVEEYEIVMSFVGWYKDHHPEILGFDETVFASDNSYAGTLDLRYRIKDDFWLIDFKTAQDIWPSHELQVSAYKYCGFNFYKTGILQLGYRRNKKKYKFTEIEDRYNLFMAARQIWEKETKGIIPLQKDFPLELKLMV